MKRPVHACLNLAVIAAGLALASPANAANVFVEVVDFGEVGCDATYRTVVDARAGERNDVAIEPGQELSLPIPNPVGGCGEELVIADAEVLVADATAALFPLSGGSCAYAGAPVQNRAVTCEEGSRVSAFLKDGDDALVVEALPAFVDAGSGADHVEVLSPSVDRVICRDGADSVVAGPEDSIAADCEQVYRLG